MIRVMARMQSFLNRSFLGFSITPPEGCGKICGKFNQRKDVENDENMAECARSAVMLDGETSKYVDIQQGAAQGCTLSPNLFKVYINDMIVAVEAAKQGVTMREDAVSGLMLADDFVGISEAPEGLQFQIEKALEYTRKWRVAVVVCNEDKVDRIMHFKWKWGED